jgi:hypothetical protein
MRALAEDFRNAVPKGVVFETDQELQTTLSGRLETRQEDSKYCLAPHSNGRNAWCAQLTFSLVKERWDYFP